MKAGCIVHEHIIIIIICNVYEGAPEFSAENVGVVVRIQS